MAFDKDEKQFLKQMFNNFEERQDKKMDKRFAENNAELLRGMEEYIDHKIEESENRQDEKNSKRHSELIDNFDEVLKEVRDSRQERTTQAHQIIKNSDRISKLENKVFKN